MTAVTPTDRPKSVRNRCVIKVFGGVFMLSRCFLDYSVGVGVFVTGLSQISSFSYFRIMHITSKSTEGCSKLKNPETRQVQEKLVSTLERMRRLS